MRKYLLTIIAALVLLISCNSSNKKDEIKVGWQTAWATQGQIIQAIDKTNIAKLCDINITFKDFLFGPDLNEAAVTGNIDVTNAGIVPIINLLAASDDWIIIGRQVDFPISIIARVGSGVNTIKDLRGKRFGVPIGGGSHPHAIHLLSENNLEIGEGPDKVNVINIKPSEMPIAIKQGQIDAVACWEPTTTLAIEAGGKLINEVRYVGFISANKNFIGKNPETIIKLLKCYTLSNCFVANNRHLTDEWFSKASGVSMELINKMKVIEPNVNAVDFKNLKMIIDDDAIELAQEVSDIMFKEGLIKRKVDMNSRINQSYSQKALNELIQSKITLDKILY